MLPFIETPSFSVDISISMVHICVVCVYVGVIIYVYMWCVVCVYVGVLCLYVGVLCLYVCKQEYVFGIYNV